MRIVSLLSCLLVCQTTFAQERPNILWLTAEDIGPHLGCYGDSYATTPHLDEFAKSSIVYLNAWSNAPVCAPARTTLISGLYPPSTGAENMRSLVDLPKQFHMYPVYMREAGYYCVNPGKEDYNLRKVGDVWDKLPSKDHWKALADHQPFMAVFNTTGTHESKIRTRPHEWKHDPSKAPIPAYHPDTPEVREDWAQYYDNITVMDQWFADHIKQLEEHGLAENTIVFFYGDHGSGMPRNKRWLYNSGLRVPLIIHVPEKYQHLIPQGTPTAGESKQLVSFVDLAPTILSLAGQKPPAHMQGNAFLGAHAAPPQPYCFGFRGRMDERIDLSRTVRNERYHYIRNYMPHRIQGEYLAYMFQTPTTRVWKELHDAGKLNAGQSVFWEPKPPEELYDLQNDPDEIHNLVDSPEHQDVLNELRRAHVQHVMEIRDIGFLPEAELHSLPSGLTPYDLGHDPKLYPLEDIFEMAQLASMNVPGAVETLQKGLSNSDSTVRYWAAIGLLIRGGDAVRTCEESLRNVLNSDPSLSVRTIAAEALAQYGDSQDVQAALDWLAEAADPRAHGGYVSLQALNSIEELGDKARPIAAKLQKLMQVDEPRGRGDLYWTRVLPVVVKNLQ